MLARTVFCMSTSRSRNVKREALRMYGRYDRDLSVAHQRVQGNIDALERSPQPDWRPIGELKRLRLSIKDRVKRILKGGWEVQPQWSLPNDARRQGRPSALTSDASDIFIPLLTSPIDGSAMRQIRRCGIELDVCPTSGAVWLDKGELEKLITLVSDEASEGEADRSRDRGNRDAGEDDFDENRRRRGKRRSRFMDIFDF